MYFFTADWHAGHANILKFCSRPFKDIREHDSELIRRHNEVVGSEDTVIHAGDFTLAGRQYAQRVIDGLNGKHIFVRGSHDKWLKKWLSPVHEILELLIDNQYVVVCHYAMRVWPRSHYNSILLFGHSHGKMPPHGRSFDVGVDGHNFYPWSWTEVLARVAELGDNPNLVERRRKERP